MTTNFSDTIMDTDDNLSYGSTIGEAITYLVKKFGWQRSTKRTTANFFTNIDGFNDVVFIRKFKQTDVYQNNTQSNNNSEVFNIISRDYSTHTEIMLTGNAKEK